MVTTGLTCTRPEKGVQASSLTVDVLYNDLNRYRRPSTVHWKKFPDTLHANEHAYSNEIWWQQRQKKDSR